MCSQKSTKSSPFPIHPPASCTQPLCSTAGAGAASSTAAASTSTKHEHASATTTTITSSMTNDQIAQLVLTNKIKDHHLEKLLNPHRAVIVRRLVYQQKLSTTNSSSHNNNGNNANNNNNPLAELPYAHDLDYNRVHGANCETVIGYIPLPVGMVGPITLNNETVYFPMATTEGCLVASTNRGCKAITQGSGAMSTIMKDGITRAPCVQFKTAREAAELKLWCEERENFVLVKSAFESTTSFGKLEGVNVSVAGRNAYVRLRCFSGDAMGMNVSIILLYCIHEDGLMDCSFSAIYMLRLVRVCRSISLTFYCLFDFKIHNVYINIYIYRWYQRVV